MKTRLAPLVALAALVLAQPASGAERGVRSCFGRAVTHTGTPGDDRITGTSGADVILGLGGDDVVRGGDGRDRICGGSGDDLLDGRYGNDLVFGAGGANRLLGGPDHDLLVGGARRDEIEGGEGHDTLVGGDGDDFMNGGDGRLNDDFLFGGDGHDFMDGGLAGSDSLYGGPGDDILYGGRVSFEFSPSGVVVDLTTQGTGVTRHATGEGTDFVGDADGVLGSEHADFITDDAGAHLLRGLGGDDVIVAAGGSDRVDGGPGSDDLAGGEDHDFLEFTDAAAGVMASLRDGIAEGAGSDSLTGFESLEGSYFDDHLTGDDGPNDLDGSFGRNTLFGLGGDDELWFGSNGHAGEGSDECWSAALTGCELNGHVDPPSLPFVADPVQGADVARIGAVRGGVAGGLGGPPANAVVVSIRRMTAHGCSWWNGRAAAFVAGACGVTQGEEVPITDGAWELRVGTDLDPGTYEIAVSWADAQFVWSPCNGFFGPTCVELRVQ